MAGRCTYKAMSEEKGERLPVRITRELKDQSRAVAALQGKTLSGLVTNLLTEEYNRERKARPDLLAEKLLKVQRADEEKAKVKRLVAVSKKSPANASERKNGKQPHTRPASHKTARKR